MSSPTEGETVIDRLRSHLAFRIYLVGLAQMAVVAMGFVAYARLTRPDFEAREAKEDAFATAILLQLDDQEALQGSLESAREDLGATVTVTDPAGRVLATTTPADAPPCVRPRPPRGGEPPDARSSRGGRPPPGAMGRSLDDEWPGMPGDGPDIQRPPRFRGAMCRIAFLRFPGGDYGRVEFRPTRPPRPPSPFGPPVIVFVLVVVGITSFLLARSIARPLDKLSQAARALGEGDLEARAGVDRRDELGEVSRSFDEMAGRVSDLLRAEKELVANVSHELRTPLSRIRVALDIAVEGDAAAARDSLADIAGDLEELERLVDDILTAARLELGAAASRGIPPLRRELLAAATLLDEAAERFRQIHPERTLETSWSAALPSLEGDPVLLRRVIDNLLDNARKYSETPIALSARAEESELVVEVVDRGIGIAPADLARVFEPFFRADRSRTRTTGGHGLGLALAARIVEAHGGHLTLASTPNEETRAVLRLPLLPPG
jgi:two-component system, OmpR family, sensor kinase